MRQWKVWSRCADSTNVQQKSISTAPACHQVLTTDWSCQATSLVRIAIVNGKLCHVVTRSHFGSGLNSWRLE